MATIFDRLVLAKTEATKGTDPTPTPLANAIRVKSVNVTVNTNSIDRQVVKQTMGMLPHLIGKQSLQAEIVVELRGSGTAGTAPAWAPLMLACRTSETVVASTSVTYKRSTSTEKSATIYVYKDGLLWKLIGAVGTVKIDAQIDNVITATFTMQAKYTAPSAVTCPTNGVFDSVQPLVMKAADVINDGASIKVGAFGIDVGNDVQHHYVVGDDQFVVANGNPSMTLTKDSVATAAEWTALSAGTDVSFSAAFGSTAGNIATITAPVARRKQVQYGERAERDTLQLTYGLYESAGDDAFSIELT